MTKYSEYTVYVAVELEEEFVQNSLAHNPAVLEYEWKDWHED